METVDKKIKILVAEDNLINQKLLFRLLQKMNAEFKIVNNGEEVMNAVEDENYDLIFMDIHMPIMDGVQATKLIKEKAASGAKDSIIIAMTANVMKNDIDNFMEIGMTDVITKPFSMSEFS
ncbi:MAG TPA: response regulator, partial [Ignavibacteriaceae bacterium]|nr:response regulator [Ignavibacteriaceae bacterium]